MTMGPTRYYGAALQHWRRSIGWNGSNADNDGLWHGSYTLRWRNDWAGTIMVQPSIAVTIVKTGNSVRWAWSNEGNSINHNGGFMSRKPITPEAILADIADYGAAVRSLSLEQQFDVVEVHDHNAPLKNGRRMCRITKRK